MARAAQLSVTGEGAGLLLERERELGAFEQALDRVTSDVGSLLMVEGAAGIGKTRLLEEATAIARGRGISLRTARGGQLEREMPFGVARQLFEPVVERASEDERKRLLAGSAGLALLALGGKDRGASAPTGDPFAPIHGLYWLVANLAEAQPLVLIVDDAHWIDTQTLRFLVYLARRLTDIPVLVIASVRSGEPGQPPELDPLRLEGEVLRPEPLSPQAVEHLIATELRSQPAPKFSAVCAEATAGNPFLLAEVVRTLRADAIEPSADAIESIEALGSESVARYVLMRLGRFGADAIALARAIAVLGGAPQLRHAASLAGLGENRARELSASLREAEILAPGRPLDFVHPLVRSAIYHDLSDEERSTLHRRAAEVLNRTGSGARDVAPHAMACIPNGDQWIVARLAEAAFDAISSGAPESATSYLERALAEPPEDDLPILYGLGRSVVGTEPRRAGDLLAHVAERAPDGRTRRSALRHAAYAYIVAGDWEEAITTSAALVELVPDDDREQRLVVEAQIFTLKLGTGRNAYDWERISSFAADSESRTPGGCLVRQAMAMGRFIDVAPLDEVIELASDFPPPAWHARTIIPGCACITLAWCGRWEEARRGIDNFLSEARRTGVLATVTYGSAISAMVDLLSGRLANAEAEARAAWDVVRSVAPESDPGFGAALNLLAARLATGDVPGARSLAGGLDLSAGAREVRFPPWPLEVRGYLELACGEFETGVKDLLEFGEGAEAIRYLNPAASGWRQEAAPALAALDRTSEAKELIAVAEERARAFGAPHVIGTVLRSRGLIEPRPRQIETLRESVGALEAYGPPHELARSLLELGAALRRNGQRFESKEPLRRALELAHSSGARGVEARAREELTAAGSRPRRVYRTGVASLTASELRTAKLAAEGLSNVEIAQRLFITRKTVEKHLSNAYTKLEIGSRGELAGVLELPTDA